MVIDPRALLLFGTNALLLYLNLLVNSSLAAWNLYLLLPGPLLVLPPLYLNHRSFLAATVATGLWIDAALPAPFGLFTLGFAIAGTFLFRFRNRVQAQHNFHPVLLAHLLNPPAILLLALASGFHQLGSPALWGHTFLTILLSQIVLFPVAPWFFNLNRLLFQLFHLRTEPEDLPMA